MCRLIFALIRVGEEFHQNNSVCSNISVLQMVQQQLWIYFGIDWDRRFRIILHIFPMRRGLMCGPYGARPEGALSSSPGRVCAPCWLCHYHSGMGSVPTVPKDPLCCIHPLSLLHFLSLWPILSNEGSNKLKSHWFHSTTQHSIPKM